MATEKEIIREYTNGEITVVWKPALCTHVTYCWKELPEVFDPNKRPWVNIHGAPTERIIKQVERCPSGALTYYKNSEGKKEEKEEKKATSGAAEAEYIVGEPLMVKTEIRVKMPDGSYKKLVKGAAFCRCGNSKNQPFCDGSHVRAGFNK